MRLKIKFRDWNNTTEYVWGSKQLSLEIGMVQPNKFENLNSRFANLKIEMTQPKKFKDREWTLFFLFFNNSQPAACGQSWMKLIAHCGNRFPKMKYRPSWPHGWYRTRMYHSRLECEILKSLRINGEITTN